MTKAEIRQRCVVGLALLLAAVLMLVLLDQEVWWINIPTLLVLFGVAGRLVPLWPEWLNRGRHRQP